MLTDRQEIILKTIVSDYVRTATPIASESIARGHDLGVSPATVRNDVAELEEIGYITRPHPSAGSVPLDKGYRLFVESLAIDESVQIPQPIRASVKKQLIDADVDDWAGVAASTLAELVGNMAGATFSKAAESRVKHLELVYLQDFLALLIVVLEQARFRRQLVRLEKSADPATLEVSASNVKRHLTGITRREIDMKEADTLSPLEEMLVEATTLILSEEDDAPYREHSVDGLRNLLFQPEFTEGEKVRTVVQGMEEGSLVGAILEEVPEGDAVKVVIGQENRGDVLRPFSVVACQYGIPGEAVGVVSAVGPTRMEYSKTIAGVKFVSTVMSEVVESVHG